jgi:hypothetical protein
VRMSAQAYTTEAEAETLRAALAEIDV